MTPKNLDEIRTDYLRDVKNSQPKAFIHEDSDNFTRANATASAVEGNYQYGTYVLKQGFVETADEENLTRHGASYGLYLKAATAASGEAEFSGEVGAIIPIGTLLELESLVFVTSEAVTIGDTGKAIAHVICQTLGIVGNQPNNTPINLSSAPQGVDSVAVLTYMVGGTNKEALNEFRNRIHDRRRKPPAGGNDHDYYVWAMNVAGVTKAFVYPLRRGLGTVDIVILGEHGLASEETIKTCQEEIDKKRPVTAKNSFVISPTPILVNVAISIKYDGSVAEDITENAVKAAVKNYFGSLAPAQEFIKSQVETIVSHVAGVFDRLIITPEGNVKATVDKDVVQWLQAGDVTVTKL